LRAIFFFLPFCFFFVLETYGFNATAQNYTPGYQPIAANPPLPRFKPIMKPFTNITSSHSQIYNKAITFAERGDWIKLKRLKHLNTNTHMEKVLLWLKLRHSTTRDSFGSIARFLKQNPYWPERNQLIQQAELLLSPEKSPTSVVDWFSKYSPRTTDAHFKWIRALEIINDKENLDKAVLSLWKTRILSQRQQRVLIKKYKRIITPELIWQRLDWLLWKGYIRSSQRMYPHVTQNQRHLAEARLRLRHLMGAVDPAIERVPLELRTDDGLVFERLRWRQRKGMMDKARELYWDIPREQKYPRLWWRERSRQIRYLLKQNNFDTAFRLAQLHLQKEGRYYAEAQWLAGWIALRYANKPEQASTYFVEMYGRVRTPVSKSRASYWAGRAFEQNNNSLNAKKWFDVAAKHSTTFYGQLANKKLGKTVNRLPKKQSSDSKTDGVSYISELVDIAIFLAEIGKTELATKFLKTASKNASNNAQVAPIVSGALKIKKPHLAVYAARRAARKGIYFISASYPKPALYDTSQVEKALIYSIVRQESNFDPEAESYKGALGLMQLMPATAKSVAKSLNIDFNKERLTSDHNYNIKLGSSYLRSLIEKYEGSYPLAIAAYNAGPHNVNKWIKRVGNPTQKNVDLIDWIERIPFGETRNYVQRVLENLTIYRELILKPTPIK
jgi:soluble lytic murein transglycosylase